MPWAIEGIVLPIDPTKVDRSVLRKQEAASILQQFPLPFDLGPDTFKLNVKGFIFPSELADQLWELSKRPDSPSVQIEVTNDTEHEFYNGRYSINKSSVKRTGPEFIKVAGNDVAVHRFDITFIQFGEEGAINDGDSGDVDLDEDGTGFDIEDIFGTFDFDKFINVINGFFTV